MFRIGEKVEDLFFPTMRAHKEPPNISIRRTRTTDFREQSVVAFGNREAVSTTVEAKRVILRITKKECTPCC